MMWFFVKALVWLRNNFKLSHWTLNLHYKGLSHNVRHVVEVLSDALSIFLFVPFCRYVQRKGDKKIFLGCSKKNEALARLIAKEAKNREICGLPKM